MCTIAGIVLQKTLNLFTHLMLKMHLAGPSSFQKYNALTFSIYRHVLGTDIRMPFVAVFTKIFGSCTSHPLSFLFGSIFVLIPHKP